MTTRDGIEGVTASFEVEENGRSYNWPSGMLAGASFGRGLLSISERFPQTGVLLSFLQGCFVPDATFYLRPAACPAAEKRPKASACIVGGGLGFRALVGQKGSQFAPFLAFKAAGLGFGVQSAA